MKTSKFTVHIVAAGRSGNDSIVMALNSDGCSRNIKQEKGSRGILQIREGKKVVFSASLHGWSDGQYETICKFSGIENSADALRGGALVIGKATSDSAKAKSCGSTWVQDGEKFALAVKFETFHGATVSRVGNTFEVLNKAGRLLAVLSSFGVSSTRWDSWIGATNPIGKWGQMSAEAKLELDIRIAQDGITDREAALEVARKKLASMEEALREMQAVSAAA